MKAKKTMKRIGNLYEKIISVENLRLADEKARRGKANTYGVIVHDKHREEHILALHDALKNKTYRTSTYFIFKVYEPKEREIYRLPYYPDRIVHHAVMNVLEPIWAKVFTHNTYSCIKHRGIHACAKQVRKIIRRFNGKPLYCLKIDIRKFYPSINHDILKRILCKKIKDKDVLWLLYEVIDSATGVPIGNYLSQYFANLYLSYFMHYVNERLRITATEYADDIVLYSDNKAQLHDALSQMREYLNRELLLEVKGNYQIFPMARNRYCGHGRSLDYVGFQFFREQVLIRKTIKQSLCRKVASLQKREPLLEPKVFKQIISAWLGWAKYSDSKHLLQTIINKDYYDFIFNKQAKCA